MVRYQTWSEVRVEVYSGGARHSEWRSSFVPVRLLSVDKTVL